MSHHQLQEVRDAIARDQLVLFVGASGTGKTRLATELASVLEASSLTVVRVDARSTASLGDFNAPVAEALACSPTDLRPPPRDRPPVRVVVDNAEEIGDAAWRGGFQDQWRALLSPPAAVGRIGAVFLARPCFRDVLVGAGSPLMNVAETRRARGLTANELAERGLVEARTAEAIVAKTGGHLALSLQLAECVRTHNGDLGEAYRSWAADAEPLILNVVEDHGTVGRGIVSDLLRAKGPIDELTLLQRRAGGDVAAGLECLKDLLVSGLVSREGDKFRVSASMLGEINQVVEKLKMPSPVVPVDEPGRHAEAAALVYRIENELRLLVVTTLAGTGAEWWSEKVPAAIAADAESLRLQEKHSRSAPRDDLHPVMYLHVGALHDLLIHKDVWGRVSTSTGIDRVKFDLLWRDFTLVRNKLAHNRPATEGDVALLREIAARLNLT